MRVLLVGSIVLPVVLYAIAAAISYHQHFDEARDRLRRNLAIVTNMRRRCSRPSSSPRAISTRLTSDVTDEQIRTNEADPHLSGFAR